MSRNVLTPLKNVVGFCGFAARSVDMAMPNLFAIFSGLSLKTTV